MRYRDCKKHCKKNSNIENVTKVPLISIPSTLTMPPTDGSEGDILRDSLLEQVFERVLQNPETDHESIEVIPGVESVVETNLTDVTTVNSTGDIELNTTVCDIEAENREIFLQTFKRHVLMKIGIAEEDLSNEVEPFPILPPMHDWREMLKDEPAANNRNSFTAVDSRYITYASDMSKDCDSKFIYGCMKFAEVKQIQSNRILSAELAIYLNVDTTNKTLILYLLNQKGTFKDANYLMKKDIKDNTSRWIVFDVKKTITKLQGKPGALRAFGINCKTCSNARRRRCKECGGPYNDILGFQTDHKPNLVIKMDSKLSPSKTRDTNCRVGQVTCCKKSFHAESREFFENIVMPRSFVMTYCTGSCNDPTLPPYNNHTIMIQNYRWNPQLNVNVTLKKILKPCCSPIAFADKSVLLLNHGVLTKYDIPNLHVTDCGCI
ncbi:hypothetical protein SNE40_004875 [Patella caerulea]|uniref:TGF-beta family profile domain-containing protein n=2 Tax=Patella caerulea TaxID=87958 RepID=A0AAN8K3U5_PATCE